MPESTLSDAMPIDPRRLALERLIAATPDAALAAIGALSRDLPGGRAADLGELVAAESLSRERRTKAFGVLAPLFRERQDGVEALTFPPAVLRRLWTAASAGEPELLVLLDEAGERSQAVADRLCRRAAALVRDKPEAVWPADGGADGASDREARLAALAEAFDLAPLARRLVPGLRAWAGRPGERQAAALRALLAEAEEVAADGRARLLDIVFAHMADAWLILRVVARAAPSGGGEAMLRGSDLGVFVERLIVAVETRLRRLVSASAEAPAPEAFRAELDWCAAVLAEMDAALDLHPKSPWGRRLRDARASAALRLGRRLAALEKTLARAFPDRRVAVTAAMTRETPRLDLDLAGPDVRAAEAACAFAAALRGPAAVIGCEAERLGAVRRAVDRLFDKADRAVDAINNGDLEIEAEGGDPRARAVHARAVAGRMAEMLETLEARDAARTIRRRIAASARR